MMPIGVEVSTLIGLSSLSHVIADIVLAWILAELSHEEVMGNGLHNPIIAHRLPGHGVVVCGGRTDTCPTVPTHIAGTKMEPVARESGVWGRSSHLVLH